MSISTNFPGIITSLSKALPGVKEPPLNRRTLYGYARVSSRVQHLKVQKDCLMSMGVKEKNIFTDKESGYKEDRKGLKSLCKKMGSGSILFIHATDRLFRHVGHYVKLIYDFNNRGIRIFTYSGQELSFYNEATLITGIQITLAQHERTVISLRTNAPTLERKSGRRKRLYSDKVLRLILEKRNNGQSIRSISRDVDIPSSTLHDLLKNL
ncbi:putative resolvase [Xenohaliotis phage pCXc-HC2016]|nr:putative resolvase [Xenohaliotis phage pCXc-HC2016]AQW89134.1 putative resolvase [Xenohaliotis phage pCXc-HR2015]